MNDELHQANKRTLDERFAKHPQMYQQLQRISELMEEAIANGATADQAEAMAIKQINELGRALLGDWAQARHDRSVAEIKKEIPRTIRDSKKN
jgi:hypothetical protein